MAATTEAPHPRMTALTGPHAALTGPHAALTGPGTAGAPRGVGERPGPGPDGAPPAPFSTRAVNLPSDKKPPAADSAV